MKTIQRHIEIIREKPHHIREKIAFGIAGLFTALIAFAWLTVNLSSGAFAIKGSSYMDSMKQDEVIVTSSKSQNLAGAAAASAIQDRKDKAVIEVVQNNDSNSSDVPQTEQTVLPF